MPDDLIDLVEVVDVVHRHGQCVVGGRRLALQTSMEHSQVSGVAAQARALLDLCDDMVRQLAGVADGMQDRARNEHPAQLDQSGTSIALVVIGWFVVVLVMREVVAEDRDSAGERRLHRLLARCRPLAASAAVPPSRQIAA